jgi:hypothetical protein
VEQEKRQRKKEGAGNSKTDLAISYYIVGKSQREITSEGSCQEETVNESVSKNVKIMLSIFLL